MVEKENNNGDNSENPLSSVASPSDPGATNSKKRRNFTPDEVLMILHQMEADPPFFKKKKVTEAWETIADILNNSPMFPRDDVKGKSLQNRWIKLRSTYEKQVEEKKKSSGTVEAYGDYERAMKELILLEQEAELQQKASKETNIKIKKEKDAFGHRVKAAALSSLKRKADEVNDLTLDTDDDENKTTPKKKREDFL